MYLECRTNRAYQTTSGNGDMYRSQGDYKWLKRFPRPSVIFVYFAIFSRSSMATKNPYNPQLDASNNFTPKSRWILCRVSGVFRGDCCAG